MQEYVRPLKGKSHLSAKHEWNGVSHIFLVKQVRDCLWDPSIILQNF